MKKFFLLIPYFLLFACTHKHTTPVPLAENVDLERFMGKWYVIANIPTFIEKGAHNAIESYAMNDDGSINTTFTFYAGGFDGKRKTYNPTGYVSEESNSLWGMQFIWPIKAEYIIAHLSDNYQYTIIARNARDYIWIMARTPEIDDETYSSLLNISTEMGYDPKRIQRVPQRWENNQDKPHE